MPDRHASSGAVCAPAASARAAVRLSVLLPLPLAGVYDYLAPRALALEPGDFVVVPLGSRQLLGVAWGDATGDVAAAKLKAVIERLPAPPMREELRRLIDWVASYTLAPAGAVLRMAMSVPDALEPARTLVGYALSGRGRAALAASPESLTAARRRVLEALAEGPPAPAADLARRAGCGAGVVRGLAALGLVEPLDLPSRPLPPSPDWRRPGPSLSAAQQAAADDLVAKVAQGGFSVTVLDGVTGSGKTEIYFAAIAATLARGKQVLVLLPEIALSAQFLSRFCDRFGVLPAQWHSDLGHAARHGAAQLPDIRVIDMRRARPERQRFLAPPVVAALAETLAAGEQAMLFLNRRGYAPLTLCRGCGFRLQCPNCTAWLVEHRFHGRLQCHHCEPLPPLCPVCGETASFAACGPGVERLAEEMAARFPAARVAVMASDTLIGPRAAAALVESVEKHEIDVLIGTQVVAKGHHFPMLTLVGVVDADLGLSGGDLRAAERTYQLLHQVAGRAGRAERPGIVYLQTYMPEHPVMRALIADDRDRFLAAEAEARRAHGWPPFGRLAALIISAADDESADLAARAFARAQPHMPGIEVLGPAPAPLAVLRGRHRRRFLLKTKRDVNIQAVLREWLAKVKLPGSVRVQADVDPYSFL